MLRRAVVVLLGLGLTAAACSDDGGGDTTAGDPTPSSTTTSEAPPTTAGEVASTTTEPVELVASFRGVTADTIKLGVLVIDFDILREQGLVDIDRGDQQLVVDAFVDELNGRGGILGLDQWYDRPGGQPLLE